MAWTKTDTKRLRGALDSAWLRLRLYSTPALVERFRVHLAANRAAIACAGIRELRNIAADRAVDDRKTVEHAKANPHVWGNGSAEIVDRFSRLALEADRDVARADKLIARVEAEGLPAELETYDPTAA